MALEKYVSRQDDIYAQFRVETASLRELRVDPNVATPSAGYIVAFRHDEAVMHLFAQFTALLGAVVPSLPYDGSNGHTTITVYGKQPLASFQPTPAILDVLSSIASRIERTLWQQVRINFKEWHFNSESIIVAGQPNEAFWEVGQRVKTVGQEHGLDLRMPWGAHITAGRFTVPCSEATAQNLRRLLQTAPKLGISTPASIDVGYYRVSQAGFELKTVRSFR